MNIFFLVPGLSEKYRSGGLLVTRDLAKLLNAKFIATHESHSDALSPESLFKNPTIYLPTGQAGNLQHTTYFIVTWGPLISEHIKLIRRHIPNARILYYAQSFGWNMKVPPRIPIICVSRYVMSQWALRARENFIAYIPPPLNPIFRYENQKRDIDILVHMRKQNKYCLEQLMPALKKENLAVEIIHDWIPQNEFAALLNHTKIFLYLTGTHRAGLFRKLPAEGFGLPALEALACGAIVGSNLLGGVTDFLTPGENCIKLQNGDLDFDLAQIKNALENFRVDEDAIKKLMIEYQPNNVIERWKKLLSSL